MKIPGYQLKKKLGEGGMATVYLALQESIQREVAFKVMSPRLLTEPGYADRFLREARIAAQLSHPNIIAIYDVGCFQRVHFMAMEYHTGGDLKQRLHQSMAAPEALRITRAIADALDFAHSKGYIHRDIKPDNILFRQIDDSPVLTDFGIARPQQTDQQMTQLGMAVGTPRYMSPEQAQGQTVDGRADLYSLGVVLYEMLTGNAPFDAPEPMALAIKHITEPVPPLPAQLEPYQALIQHMLAKQAEQRPASGQEVVLAIDQLLRRNDKPLATASAAFVAPRFESASMTPPEQAATVLTSPAPVVSQRNPAKEAPSQRVRMASDIVPYDLSLSWKEVETGSFLSRRYDAYQSFGAENWEQFSKQFTAALQQLREWAQNRKKKAGSIRMTLFLHPWIRGRAMEQLGRLANTTDDELASFLLERKLQLEIVDISDSSNETLAFNELDKNGQRKT